MISGRQWDYIRRGVLESNIPFCCVRWFVDIWVPLIDKVGVKHPVIEAYRRSKHPRACYIQCPECHESGCEPNRLELQAHMPRRIWHCVECKTNSWEQATCPCSGCTPTRLSSPKCKCVGAKIKRGTALRDGRVIETVTGGAT